VENICEEEEATGENMMLRRGGEAGMDDDYNNQFVESSRLIS